MSGVTAEELNLLIEQTYKVEKEFNELKSSYAHLQDTVEEVVEFLPNAIWILDEDGDVFLQNSQAKSLSELLELLESKNNDYEVKFNSSSYLIKSSSYKDKIMLSATDITEQKRKENLATMGQMAAHLSHEIRNPIGSISLLSSTLKKRVIPENVSIVEEIQKSVSRIERIIKATLMFSKGVDANMTQFEWNELQEELSSDIGYYSYSKDITFIFPQQQFTLYADKGLLEMLFSNFLTNAIDAIELDDNEDGVVEIIYETDDKYHIFYIYDSGIMIENTKELFEAFRSTKVKGNGLGLVLSRQIAEAHGGSVELLSGDKKGFEIKLSI
ncbi:MAG: HAMP domain-containing histidine kinase [Sulfurimonas sp.]|uniref:sensor histidine kinase n=1 Tax=Sulfurimonas sp. TaxID=2022749 RepID=UPI002637109C|nr:HAMP domain-containing sensor histidine kinase [Sulfurimonas sp.]MCW8894988.1 HAMP domain-containing histidine kinase [Sulfurimonas sp.]MCW8953648.1 HAMP domain-containing histidine kinase [Sulfurimonas sp.]MCW9066856.1 HAMP domain-containing histidine kinase [Sulfurimonas sp.]